MDEKRGKFIVLGKKRIKIGNIKNYGISSSMKDYEKIYKPIEHSKRGLARLFLKYPFNNIELVWEGETEKLTEDRRLELIGSCQKRYRNKEGEIVTFYPFYQSTETTWDEIVTEKEIKYLYITTFQKDNFVFLSFL